MITCKGKQHFSFVPCKSDQCPGLWRREAKLHMSDPGFGVSPYSESCYQPVTEQTWNTLMFGIFSGSNI